MTSDLTTLRACLHAVKNLAVPSCWQAAVPTIHAEREHFEQILAAGHAPIYGANTRVGHRDLEVLTPDEIQAFHRDFLKSHTLGSAPWYTDHIVRHISYAKMYALCSGGSGISQALYEAIAASVINPAFVPKVPRGCTYSCGDVIPGAHWAKALLTVRPDYQPAAGEVMALINGSFVHVGYTLALIEPLSHLGALLIETTRLNNRLVSANRVNFATPHQPYMKELLSYVAAGSGTQLTDYSCQDPISVRATPQILETFVDGMRSLCHQLDYQLRSPSNNPLFNLNIDYPLSQASFLAPSLSIKTAAMIEAILFALWASVNRTQYLLSGQIQGIPQDASNPQNALQFIQMPKLMMSNLERCRQRFGRRIFAAGAQTSHGIEDLWTYGVNTTEQLEILCQEGSKLLAIELYVGVKCTQLFDLPPYGNPAIASVIQAATVDQSVVEKILTLVKSGSLKETAVVLSDAVLFDSHSIGNSVS